MAQIDNFLNNSPHNSDWYINSQTVAAPKTNAAPDSAKPKTTEQTKPAQTTAENTALVRDEFVKAKKENGLIRKFYNFMKNVSGIGFGSKKLEKEIDKYEKGEISKEEADKKIEKYRQSQKNATQAAGDVGAAAASISTFALANKYLKIFRADEKLNSQPMLVKKLLNWSEEGTSKTLLESKDIRDRLLGKSIKIAKKIVKGLRKHLKSPIKSAVILMPILALTGATTKQFITDMDLLGSKEFSVKKKDFKDKKEYKAAKKAARKAKAKQRRKDFRTGAAAGALAPITALLGGIVGVPAYLAGLMGLRYATDKSDGNKKSFNDFAQKFKDNGIVNTAATLLVALPALKGAHYNKVLGKNLEKVVTKLENKTLKLPDLPSNKTTYKELEELMLDSPAIKSITNSREPMDEIITKLSDENIFAVKFLQIKNGFNPISRALREDCPPTRTLEEAQAHINKLWGSDDYKLSKLLGVGTVAETYLAKDKSGKEVCIKVLKNGITAEKINKDKAKFLKMVTGDTPKDKLTEDQKYLIRNIEDLANGISKEVDFKNEMNAAEELRKHCKVTDVAKPIEVKDGIYVMEKAPGISVKTLVDYYDCERELRFTKRAMQKSSNPKYYENDIKELEAKMKEIKSRAPEFEDFEMNAAQIKRLLKNYIDLQVEQFSKIDKNGKVIHADIHPGNIFINLNSLKTGKGKLFTLIDTGNTINMSKEQAKASLKLTGFINKGNVKDLSETVLEGAVLPQGMTHDQALEKIQADLKKYFFDNETKINTMNMDTFHVLSDNILRKYGIISNNTQLNFTKTKTSAQNSFNDLCSTFIGKKYGDMGGSKMSGMDIAATALKFSNDVRSITQKMLLAQKSQETKNLFQMSLKEAWQFLKNPNNLKTNSEEYLTYKVKQRAQGSQTSVLGQMFD
ncbi:MAG: AarF/UbiB family protein [Cyanobacteriota bacterium]|nr:AarF/UbiB family protein [Cyanobacteriota bacterium]